MAILAWCSNGCEKATTAWLYVHDLKNDKKLIRVLPCCHGKMKLKGSKTKKHIIKTHMPRRVRSNIGTFSVSIKSSGEDGEEPELLGDLTSTKLSGVRGSAKTSVELTESVSSDFVQFNRPK